MSTNPDLLNSQRRREAINPMVLRPDLVPAQRMVLPLRPKGELPSYRVHLERYGPLLLGGQKRPAQQMLSLADRWDIRGRGGAGFPLAKKLHAVATASGRTKRAVVIGNGSESEPLSYKDRALLWESPHLVLDGLELMAIALGTTDVFLNIHMNPELYRYLVTAVGERVQNGRGIDTVVTEAPDRYVGGQETAVINLIERGRALPRFQPPRPSTKGLRGRPTLVSNVETMARLALAYHSEVGGVVRGGGPQSLGVMGTLWTPKGGAVFEALPTDTLGDVARRIYGTLEIGSTLIVGGYYGTFVNVTKEVAETQIARLHTRELSFGAGLVVVFPPDACVVCEADRVISYLGGQSAGQCGPCMFGLPAIANEFHAVATGSGGDLDKIWRWSKQIHGRGACTMPDGFSNLVRSILHVRMPELKAHAVRRCSGRDYGVMAATLSPHSPNSKRGLLNHVRS